MKPRVSLLVLIAILLVVGRAVEAASPVHVDVRQAIAIGDSAVKAHIQNWSELELVTVKRFSVPLNDLIRTTPVDPYQRGLYEKLKNRTYWLVYYVTPTAEFGGDVGVFVDAKAGTVIEIYQGK